MIKIFLKKQLWKKYSQYFFWSLFAFVLMLGVLYLYFMNFAVLKTAERNINIKKITQVKRGTQGLEAEYIGRLEEFDVDYAKSIGFVESEPVSYIYRQKSVAIR